MPVSFSKSTLTAVRSGPLPIFYVSVDGLLLNNSDRLALSRGVAEQTRTRRKRASAGMGDKEEEGRCFAFSKYLRNIILPAAGKLGNDKTQGS